MTTPADISARDWSMALQDTGRDVVEALDDIAQCLRIIVTTQKGSDPLRPDFACDLFSYLDKPTTTMTPHAIREITAAVRRYEPRVRLLSVVVAPRTDQGWAWVDIELQWTLNVEAPAAQPRRTLVTIARMQTD